MNKNCILQSLLAKLQEDLNRHLAANKRASAGATDSESRAETKWDTCGLEASYLARGHAQQFNELSEGMQQLRGITLPNFANCPIGTGALIEVEMNGTGNFFLLLGCGGGNTVMEADQEVTVITPQTLVGRALLGKKKGDTFSFRAGSEGKIVNVE